jgi:peptidoglycan/xylan/chitin deacetylase (PgdA/CDA1 family)
MFFRKQLLILLLLSVSTFGSDKDENITQGLGHATVFMYHHFGQSKYPSTNIRLEQFEQHLEYLSQNGYQVWPLSTIIRYLLEGKALPAKTVALSMDDAYISIYTEAYPRLKQRNWPFTVFVNTLPVDNKSASFMSWDQMREMRLAGAEFANHSLSHMLLMRRNGESRPSWKKRLYDEIESAQKRLQQELGENNNENPRMLAYPFGEYDLSTAKLIRAMGYVGFSQTSGPLDMHSDFSALPRFAMAEAFGNMDGFRLKLQALPFPLQSLSPKEPLVGVENPPVLNLKLKYPMKNMGCYLGNGTELRINYKSDTEIQVRANDPIQSPRDRYTCTAPAKDGHWYWYSHLWIVP